MSEVPHSQLLCHPHESAPSLLGQKADDCERIGFLMSCDTVFSALPHLKYTSALRYLAVIILQQTLQCLG